MTGAAEPTVPNAPTASRGRTGSTAGAASAGGAGAVAGAAGVGDAAPSADERMTVVAARSLGDGDVCFVGIGLPSTAANLARRTHAPGLVLVYESGTLDARPDRLPLSIGDGVLAETAMAVVGVPEVFAYWLQAGRVDVGFLGAAQIDRFANLNTTVIGAPAAGGSSAQVRLPGAGGAPEIAASCRAVVAVVRHNLRTFVDRVDFRTSVGFGDGPGDRERWGLRGGGPRRVVTDLGVLEPDPVTCELELVAVHPGVRVDDVRAATGWALRVRDSVEQTPEPTAEELAVLRALQASS